MMAKYIVDEKQDNERAVRMGKATKDKWKVLEKHSIYLNERMSGLRFFLQALPLFSDFFFGLARCEFDVSFSASGRYGSIPTQPSFYLKCGTHGFSLRPTKTPRP